MFERIRHMLIKEFIQVFRDPRMRMVIFVIPCIQVFVISYAISMDVKHVPTAVYDLDNSQASRDVVASFVRSGYFDVVERITSDKEATALLDRSKVSAVLHIMHGFADDMHAGRTAQLQVLVDGTDSNTANIVQSYAVKIAAAYSQNILVERYERRIGAINLPGRPDLQNPGLVQREPGKPQFFRARRAGGGGLGGDHAFD